MSLHRVIVKPLHAADPDFNFDLMKHNQPGSYTLVIHIDQDVYLPVGRLGVVRFSCAYYTYTGSALDSGGLRARVGRHVRNVEKNRAHWHVDQLLGVGRVTEVWWRTGTEREECAWSASLATIGTLHAPGFGASDCRCPGHLVRFENQNEVSTGYVTLIRAHLRGGIQ